MAVRKGITLIAVNKYALYSLLRDMTGIVCITYL